MTISQPPYAEIYANLTEARACPKTGDVTLRGSDGSEIRLRADEVRRYVAPLFGARAGS